MEVQILNENNEEDFFALDKQLKAVLFSKTSHAFLLYIHSMCCAHSHAHKA